VLLVTRIRLLVAQLSAAVASLGFSEAQVCIRPGQHPARVHLTFDVPDEPEPQPQPEPPAPEPPPPAAPAAMAVPVPSPAPEPAPPRPPLGPSLEQLLRQLGQAASDSDPYPSPHLRYLRSRPFWNMAQSASQAVG
jgi:outer membrane biosynthesis protein TonB